MRHVRLKEITRVYRFGINARQWERTASTEDHFIAYKLYGRTTHESGGKVLNFSKDMIMIANRQDLYRVTQHEFASEGRRGGCIAIHFTTETPFDMHLAVYDCAEYPQLKSEFFRILDAWNQYRADGNLAAEYACVSHFYAIFSQLTALMEGKKRRPGQNQRIALAKEYLDRNYANSALSIADAAASVNLSQRRLNQLFLEQYRETPGRYLTAVRMRAAADLLRQSQLAVSEIAVLAGYADASYFIRVFHREMGLSPSAYRKESK